jgi:hypothetical protein
LRWRLVRNFDDFALPANFDDDAGQGLGVVEVADGVADGDVVDAGDGHDLARRSGLDRDALEAFVDEELLDVALGVGLVAEDQEILRRGQRAAHDAPDREAADVVVVRGVADDHLEGAVGVARRAGDLLEDGVEERRQILRLVLELALGEAVLGDGVDRGEVHLLVAGFEVAEEVEHLGEDLVRAGVAAVDLVDHDDDREAALEALRQDEARLRERSLGGVDEQQGSVGHHQRALDLAAEVRVARGVDDVDLDALVPDARVLREDGDPALFFEIVRVHHPFGDDLVVSERAGLAKDEVDERGLAMVDVGDDGDVSEILARHMAAPV